MGGSVTAVIPAKRLAKAKSRLAPVLDLRTRSALALAMFEHVVTVAMATSGFARVVAVTSDPCLGNVAKRLGAGLFDDGGAIGLNKALESFFAADSRNGDSALIVPSDLPLVQPGDFASLIERHEPRTVTIVADHLGVGTNALVLPPHDPPDFHFGAGSLHRHVEAARRAGFVVRETSNRHIAFDVDSERDFRVLQGLAKVEPSVARILRAAHVSVPALDLAEA